METKWRQVKGLLVLGLLACLLHTVWCEKKDDAKENYAQNPHRLRVLEVLESKIYKFLLKVKEAIDSKNNPFKAKADGKKLAASVQQYLKGYEATTLKLQTDFRTDFKHEGKYQAIWNPLATFKMMKRLSLLWPDISKNVDTSQKSIKSQLDQINSYMRKRDMNWPSKKDLSDVAVNILKIQYTYHLEPEQLINGNIAGVQTPVKLTADDCRDLGDTAGKNQYYTLAISWLQAGIKMLEAQGRSSELKEAEKFLRGGIHVHDKQWNSFGKHFYNRKIQGDFTDLKPRYELYYEQHKLDRKPGFSNMTEYAFQNLCAGKTTQTVQEQAELFCWYERKRSPSLYINPFKAELLAKDPIIVRYYDVLSESQIQFMLSATAGRLKMSQVLQKNLTRSTRPKNRASSGTYLRDNLYEETILLQQKLSAVSALKLGDINRDEEMLGIVAYSFGSFYDVHSDMTNAPWLSKFGRDRIATFVLYLSDVEFGGGTAFTYPGIVAEPIRGSAVFWYNIDTEGHQEPRTWHGGCPVILGEKWIANKWVRAGSQFLSHKCIEGMEEFQFYANDKPVN